MRASEMQTGKQYEMQRGPTRSPRRVTLLDTAAPSGRSHWVLVRMEDGIGVGKELEAPSQSLDHLPGDAPAKAAAPRRSAPPAPQQVPPGWKPKRGEAVGWTQTLGSRMTVLRVDGSGNVARIIGKVLGVDEEFDAPVSELSPFATQLVAVEDNDLEEKLKGRLPDKLGAQGELKPERRPEPVEEYDNEDLVDRLVFSPHCVASYRRRFARKVGLGKAEERLRAELRAAKKVRTHSKEYLRLRVDKRFEVALTKRPDADDMSTTYINRLIFAASKQKRDGSRKAA